MAVAVKVYKRETKELSLTSREERGKGPVGRLRREEAMLPGVVYGHHQEPKAFKIPALVLERAMAAGGRNAIFVLTDESGASERAVVREVQYHKVRGDIQHIDFMRINADEEYTASVPLVTVGNPVGVRVNGGALQHSINAVDMHCVASEMPSQLEIDINALDIGDSIHVSDLLEAESRIVTDAEITIVSVLAPRLSIDEELEAEAEAAAEAEEGEGNAGEGEGDGDGDGDDS
jgi:large subunit ribosomal protein L25